jgi:ketosteroid isomerase-like protein
MSQENVEIVRGVYEHFDATHTVDLGRLAPNVILDLSNFESWPERRLYEGHEGVQEFIGDWLEPWDMYQHDVEALLDAGDEVVAVVHVSGTASMSGAAVEMRVGHVWGLIDGTIVRGMLYSDPAKALEAAGLSE